MVIRVQLHSTLNQETRPVGSSKHTLLPTPTHTSAAELVNLTNAGLTSKGLLKELQTHSKKVGYQLLRVNTLRPHTTHKSGAELVNLKTLV